MRRHYHSYNAPGRTDHSTLMDKLQHKEWNDVTELHFQSSFCYVFIDPWLYLTVHKCINKWFISSKWNKFSSQTRYMGFKQQIYKGDCRHNTSPCHGITCHGAQIGGLWVFANHTHKNKCVHDLCSPYGIFSVFILSRCRWHTHFMNRGYFDYEKTRRPPIWAHAGINGAVSGISLEYLWVLTLWWMQIKITVLNGA